MGRKPLFALAGVCLAGIVLCGCSGRQTYNNRQSMPSSQAREPGAPTPSPGSVTNATGWDNAPAKNVGTPMNPSDLSGKTGSGMGASDLRAPAGSLTAGPGALPGGANSSPPSSWNTSPGMGARTPSSLGGMPPSGGTGGLNSMPPPTPPGDAMGTGLSSGGSPSPLAPPPPPAPRPGSGTGYGLGSDPGAGLSGQQPTGLNQSRMDSGYRTVPPGVPSDPPGVPAMPSAVPTMPSKTLEP
jgi:hypothetical protein